MTLNFIGPVIDQYFPTIIRTIDRQCSAIDKSRINAYFDLTLCDLDLDLCDLDLYHVLSLTYQYHIMKQSSQYLSLYLNYGLK